MSIKNLLVRLAEKITGRNCHRCTHNCGGRCIHPNGAMFVKCWQSITRPGFEYSESVYCARMGEHAAQGLQEGLQNTEAGPAGGLTEEEQHQLQKIKAALQEASETARDGGLLGTDPNQKAVPADLDDRTESGLFEED